MTYTLNHLEQGAGLPLIFLHGIGSDAAGWRYQLDRFSAHYRAIAVDLPGYGQSKSLPSPTIAQYTQCLHDFLLKEQLERPILVGHSLGGMIVQDYLATYPGTIRAAVLYGASPAFGPPDGAWQQQFIKARLAPLDAGKTMRDLAPGIVQQLVGPAAQKDGIALASQRMATVPNDTFRAAVLSLLGFDRRANLAKIDMPCLLLVGSEDTNAPPAMVEKMATKIAGARYQVLPGLGHLAHLEDPAVFNAALEAFLDDLSL